ncbi:MAG TPA: hypothetical protein VGZ22_09200 [Isosphaeraceae bacterium]|jgi:hypothetical protein|nr:hypothetical protein [Isosphaeraceae bacterium]
MKRRDTWPKLDRTSRSRGNRTLAGFLLLLIVAGSCSILMLFWLTATVLQAFVAEVDQIVAGMVANFLAGLVSLYQFVAVAIVLAPLMIILFLTDPWYALTLLLRLWTGHGPCTGCTTRGARHFRDA